MGIPAMNPHPKSLCPTEVPQNNALEPTSSSFSLPARGSTQGGLK